MTNCEYYFLEKKMTKDEIRLVNKTARSAGAVGKNALIPKIITGRYPYLGYKMLDFGSGPRCVQTMNLKELGYDVTPYEIGDNSHPEIHLQATEEDKGKYDLIFASNVLNVLPTVEAWEETLEKIAWFLGGKYAFAILNFPQSPRKCAEVDKDVAFKLICKYFAAVMVENHNGTRVFYCYKNGSED
jgi:hypothetical protein